MAPTTATVEQLKALYAATDEQHDPASCPVPPERLRSGRGIEVGQIFYFGTKYSKPMGATVMGPDGQEIPVEMGSYGIGVSRLVGALDRGLPRRRRHHLAGAGGAVPARRDQSARRAMPPAMRSSAELEASARPGRRRGAGRRSRRERRRQVRDDGPDRPALAGGGRTARRQAGRGRAQGARAPASAASSSPEALIGAARSLMFAPVERLIAGRYLRPRREEGFISVIAAVLAARASRSGSRTLIVVLAVMSGFRAELLGRVLGLNGHVTLRSAGPEGLADFDAAGRPPARRRRRASRSRRWSTGQVMASANGVASGALVRGIRPEDLAARETHRRPSGRAARSPS